MLWDKFFERLLRTSRPLTQTGVVGRLVGVDGFTDEGQVGPISLNPVEIEFTINLSEGNNPGVTFTPENFKDAKFEVEEKTFTVWRQDGLRLQITFP